MSPVIFELFGFEIRWYSVLILLGVCLGYFLILNESKRFHYDKEVIFNLMFWTLIIGIIGARLYYVVFNFSYYKDNLKEILMVWNGGLAIHGGIICGLVTSFIFCKKHKLKFLKILDILAPAMILGQAIGRWGNFFNHEAYGSIVAYRTLLKFKIIPQFVIDNMEINGFYHLPMFYFESLMCLLGFVIMMILRRKNYLKKGMVFSFYLVWYGLTRFFIEIFRTDSLMFLNFKAAQIVSLIMVLVGIIIFIIQVRKPKLEELYDEIEN